jgi:ABC-type uncharacterized transport system involved in gliding motility auxiliary subunit
MKMAKPHKNFLVNFGRICGAVGLVLWASTPLTWLLTAEIGPQVIGKLVVGAALITCYLATNGDFFSRILGARSTGLFAISGLSTALVFALVGAVNYAASLHPKEWDMTREGLYTLSEQTQGLLNKLADPVHVNAFYGSTDPLFATLQETLERYAIASNGSFTYSMVDPQSRPDLVEKFQITDRGPRLVFTAAGREARVKDPEEQELTYALIKVAQPSNKQIYFLVGHQEADATDAQNPEGMRNLADALVAEGYSVQSLHLAADAAAAAMGTELQLGATAKAVPEQGTPAEVKPGATAVHAAAARGKTPKVKPVDLTGREISPEVKPLQVPDDAAALVIAGPRRPLLEPEVAAIETFLARGGRVVAMLEPHQRSNLETLLQTYKIALRDDIIVDTNPLNRLLGLGAAAPMIEPSHVEHPMVTRAAAPLVMLTARSMQALNAGPPEVAATALAHAGQSAWGETHIAADGTAGRDAEDNLGPLDVVVAAHKDVGSRADRLSPQARLVVFGDSDWVTNHYLSLQGNQDFVLNAVHWVAEQAEKITIRPKSRAANQLFLSGEQLNKLKFFSMDLLPVLLVACGLGIVLVRRQR